MRPHVGPWGDFTYSARVIYIFQIIVKSIKYEALRYDGYFENLEIFVKVKWVWKI